MSTYLIQRGSEETSITIRRIGESAAGGVRYGVRIGDGEEAEVDAVWPVDDVISLVHQGRSWEAGLVEIEDGYEVEVVGVRHELEVMDPRRKALRMADSVGQNSVKTQMPGRIVRILVEVGQAVEEGTPLIVVEAMKMENELRATAAGTVAKICVEEGEQVQARTTLIDLE